MVAGLSIKGGFKHQKINRIFDSVEHFYYKLKNNIILLDNFFNKETDSECILTYFCQNEEKASNFSLVYRVRFEDIRTKVVDLLLNNDYAIFSRHLKECKIDYKIDELNVIIKIFLKEILKCSGATPILCDDDNEYFHKRPVYFCDSDTKKGEEIALEKSKEIHGLIMKILEEIQILSDKIIDEI